MSYMLYIVSKSVLHIQFVAIFNPGVVPASHLKRGGPGGTRGGEPSRMDAQALQRKAGIEN